ncbi:hypothetical protein ASPZODRAFT_141945 [Penicilliopsis zonata CBS 506.65]|uniref:Ribosomal RNA-processing protein 42 n=1 Tax=Penicilliopsis zonata CBS 506.65 TaxID=1073090 RepID=A0A1L9SIX9_9EURO|nr:hypothetical protein ASPZODRAFT_141945 [Penicilliopsis zonata CBS 506.65]OJJ47192.1 hypothetical protein ASPZODRAFT_141945 [Penicilliopsis zonata CBS 506.65]
MQKASSASQTPHLSPAELSYLYTSLALPGAPIRPDGRSPTQFRPLCAETGILPGTNGSARIGFADGTQAIVGVKAEVERTDSGELSGSSSWVQISVEIPGFRDDDALPVFLSEMMREALGGVDSDTETDTGSETGLKGRLVINRRWHWRLYIDVLLLSQPLSYPLPLLSLTTHLALLSTKLPKLKSQGEEDPFFDDDWEVAQNLYPRHSTTVAPPITLLVVSVGENIIFDPNREEIAVADAVMAVSVTRSEKNSSAKSNAEEGNLALKPNPKLKLLSIRTIDPPSRLTQPGVPDAENATTGDEEVAGVWRPRRGGVKRAVVANMVQLVLGEVGEEVLQGLEGFSVHT